MAYYDPAGASGFREGHCSLCLHDKSSAAIDFYPYNISCTLDRLRESATEKCKFCALMVDAVLWTISTALVKEDQLESVRLCQGLFLRVKGQSKSLEVEFLDHEGPCGYPSYGRGKEKGHLKAIPGDTASKQTSDTISAWLQDCLANHDECPSPKVHERDSSARRPTRLLDLSNHAVRLREDAPTGGYACLSHRWGEPKNMFCLKTDTLERFKVEIPHDMLPQSFKDAVDICRRLSISLLWIDALCIVQDDRDDWKREAPRMADIYEHAAITIAAAAAHNGAGGCYQLARAEHRGTSLPSRPDVHVRVRPTEYPGFGSNSRDWPLMSRGWIYQEMRLSPRKLHFAASEVIWDCARGRRSESGTNDRDHAPTKDWMRLSDQNLRLRWYHVVDAYTGLDLTFESDRLPALSALTERMERLRGGDQFLVGLWKTTLLLDLLWYAMPVSDDIKVRKAAVKTFPSWTWVSMSARISWLGGSLSEVVLDSVAVVGVQCQTDGIDRMGDIVGQASISIRASLIRLGDLAFWTPGEVADMDKGDQGAMRCWAQPQEPANKTGEDPLAMLRSQIGAEAFLLDPGLPIDDNRKDVRRSQAGTASRRKLNDDTLIIPLVCCYQDYDIYALCVEPAGASSEYKRLGVASMAHVEELKLRLKCGVLPEDDELDIQRQTAFGRARHIVESLPVSAITLI